MKQERQGKKESERKRERETEDETRKRKRGRKKEREKEREKRERGEGTKYPFVAQIVVTLVKNAFLTRRNNNLYIFFKFMSTSYSSC